jgi:hypothetical protein
MNQGGVTGQRSPLPKAPVASQTHNTEGMLPVAVFTFSHHPTWFVSITFVPDVTFSPAEGMGEWQCGIRSRY